MIELVRMIADEPEFSAAISGLAKKSHHALVTGLTGTARHLYMAGLHLIRKERDPNASLIVVTHSMTQAETAWEDLRELLPDDDVFLFPEREISIVDLMAYSPEVMTDRLHVLQHFAQGKSGVVVCTIASITQPVTTKPYYRNSFVQYVVGESVDHNHLEQLLQCGYERVDMVETKGQFSVRGGIVDVFPLTEENPFRIELFDDEVDSIRTFDIASQRSIDKVQVLEVGPTFDLLIPPSVMMKAAEQVQETLLTRVRTTTDVAVRDRLQSVVGEDVRRLMYGLPFYGQVRYAELFSSHVGSLADYVSPESVLCLDEPTRLMERQRGLEKEFSEWLTSALMRGEMVSGTLSNANYDLLWNTDLIGVQFATFNRATGNQRYKSIVSVTAKAMQNFHGQMNLLKSEIARWEKSNMRVVFCAATKERADRLERVLSDYRIEAVRTNQLLPKGKPQVVVANVSAGFELPMSRIAVIVETEVFSSRKKSRRLRTEMTDAERIKSYQELKTGDYVVHVNHGIGKYLGIRTLEIDGRHKDYLHLSYAGNDSLYVPVDQIDQVQRYVGSEDKEPRLNHLGGTEWTRVKQKVSKTVRDIAEDLVKLYAARQSTPGHPFAQDTPWQTDFESMFPYDETPDQLKAIEEIKKDMEQPRPMDRLLCGDVGYGKTEVAIRSAFKAVMDGKQVAVLVPTTVLAHQHYETFKERFAGFPVTVEVLSRFRSRTEAQAVLKGLKDGSIDVVIGTHRLLQKTIHFKDLGLLIVDEEQRFGVTHKERLKQLRTNVDCLTLTATPIPRTLHMSMLGVRDLSVIETPPENRFPVQTYVVEYNDSLIREAIERELSRGGQVYFLYNQVSSIQSMTDRLSRLVPEARIHHAHGQMAEDELERVMMDFLDGDIDVLVTTTIIETGLDIPNVNTLVVYDADRLGLSQLYQLRGRVGRSNRIAYAYFTYQKDKVLTEVAEKRLQAIKEFTELGSGFKIAMRDLAIRGAGNLLGAEQHGFINSVGFDLYSDMLAQAVKEVRGDEQVTVPDPTIDLSVEAYLPDSYISDPAQKISMYKKFRYVRSLEAANDLEEELEDRFGDLPQCVRNLLDITRIKTYAVQYGVDTIGEQGSELTIRFRADAALRVNYDAMIAAALKNKGTPLKRQSGVYQVTFQGKGMSEDGKLRLLLSFFRDYGSKEESKKVVEQFAN